MKTIKRYNPNTFNAMHAAVAFLAYWAVNLCISFLLTDFEDALAARGVVIDPYAMSCLGAVVLMVGLGLLVWIMCAAARVHPVNGGGFLIRKGQGVEITMAFVAIFAVLALFMPLQNAVAQEGGFVQEALGLPSFTQIREEEGASNGWAVLYAFILVPLLPAFFEELLFRGVILRGFLQFGKVAAVVLSALLFALAHGRYDMFFTQFIGGLVIGFLVVETKNFFVGMAAHFANNFFTLAMGMTYGVLLVRDRPHIEVYIFLVDLLWFVLGAVCLIAAVVYFVKRLLHTQKCPERACGEVAATFVVNDMVSGTLSEEIAWYDCGKLTPKNTAPKTFLTSKDKRGRMNKKASLAAVAVLVGIGILLSLCISVLSFILA